jgi:hypothetical protein
VGETEKNLGKQTSKIDGPGNLQMKIRFITRAVNEKAIKKQTFLTGPLVQRLRIHGTIPPPVPLCLHGMVLS